MTILIRKFTHKATMPFQPPRRPPWQISQQPLPYGLRLGKKSIILCLLLTHSLADANEVTKTCVDKADTQLEINQCSSLENQAADQTLNQVYQAVLKQHTGDKALTDNLKLAQRAWLKWRDAEMAAIYPHSEEPGYYGSSFGGCWNDQLAAITRERTRQLRKWLDGVEEGDICSGSFPIQSPQ